MAGQPGSVLTVANYTNKKFELMLTRRAKAYSSSCSQTVSLSSAISSQFILGVCDFKGRPYNTHTIV